MLGGWLIWWAVPAYADGTTKTSLTNERTMNVPISDADAVSFWWLAGSTNAGVKRIHTMKCRHAKVPYNWAKGKTAPEIVAALAESGAIEWHDACRQCAPNLSVAIGKARFERAQKRAGVGT